MVLTKEEVDQAYEENVGLDCRRDGDEGILRRIEELETEIAIDGELSCGMAPAGAYDGYYEEIYRLKEQLGNLKEYEKPLPVDDEFPFPL